MTPCCVPGCEEEGNHRQTFTVQIGGWGGEIETESHFCCGHYDRFAKDDEPFLDLVVIGQIREG